MADPRRSEERLGHSLEHTMTASTRTKSGASSVKSGRNDASAPTLTPTPKRAEEDGASGKSNHSDSGSGTKPAAAGKKGPSGAYLELPKWRFWTIFVSLLISVFLFSLDQLIIATAIPKITVQFNALTQLPWLANGFFMTLFGLNLIYAQFLMFLPSKHVVLLAVFVFELGSLICGVAPNMVVLIVGRAVAGAGAAGIFSGGMVVVAELTPLHSRAQYFALIGVCFAMASILGPLVGGAFADHVSWRWCFYINLPIGGVAFAGILVFQPTTKPMGSTDYRGYGRHMLKQVAQCDWVGATIAMAWAVCLILPLQWGGVQRKWNDGGVISCLVLTGVLPFVFVGWEYWIGPERQMLKLALLKRRNIVGGSMLLFWLFAVFMIDVYYLSLAFQAQWHYSATDAGVRLLPLIMVQIFVMMATARIIPKVGRFKWIIVAGPCFLAIGSGLLYTIKAGTPIAHVYGFQVLLAMGIGVALQNSMLVLQFELRDTPRLITMGTGIGTFIGFAGRIIGISLAGAVFENMIQVNIDKYIPGVDPRIKMAMVHDASAIWTVVPEPLRPQAIVAYAETVRLTFLIGVPFAILGLASALVIRNDKMPTKAEEQERMKARKEAEAAEAEAEAAGGAGPSTARPSTEKKDPEA